MTPKEAVAIVLGTESLRGKGKEIDEAGRIVRIVRSGPERTGETRREPGEAGEIRGNPEDVGARKGEVFRGDDGEIARSLRMMLGPAAEGWHPDPGVVATYEALRRGAREVLLYGTSDEMTDTDLEVLGRLVRTTLRVRAASIDLEELLASTTPAALP